MCLAIPAKVVEILEENASQALVEVAGVRRHIDTGLLQDDRPVVGDWVLVHVGFAMTKISEEQARDQLQMLSRLGEASAVLEEMQGYGNTEDLSSEASPPWFEQAGKAPHE